MIQCQLKTALLAALKTDLYVLPFFCEQEASKEELRDLASFELKKRLADKDFNAANGEMLLLFNPDKNGPRRLLLLGLGEREEFCAQVWREICGDLGLWLRSNELSELVCELPSLDDEGPDHGTLALALGKGIGLADFVFDRYKDGKKSSKTRKLGARVAGAKNNSVLSALKRGVLISEGANAARELASEPGNVATPSYLVSHAKAIAKRGGKALSVQIFRDAELKKMGCGGILSVGQGSVEASAMIALRYDCGRKNAPTLAIVGKGVTFDTGGISLKPGSRMEDMKYDMCGAAAVLGLFSVIHELKPAVNVVGVVPSAENMPDGKALKPGDVIRVFNGKTVEVLNTDAEGRLLLIDAISWVEKTHKPDAIVDFATLTGAVLIGLGQEMSAVLGNDPGLLDSLVDCGSSSGDLCWPLPLTANYCKLVKSRVADIRNHTNSRHAGTITAAAFLKEGVIKETPWAHVDIAGTANRDAKREGCAPGATGVGVHLVADLLDRFEA